MMVVELVIEMVAWRDIYLVDLKVELSELWMAVEKGNLSVVAMAVMWEFWLAERMDLKLDF